ncbi:hypothetical protein [Methanosarcina horonobensis]|uniref:hypothetical protein n=1 Tax=Methanosarcina horonobensis TaxID=418008 RepID=UPI000A7BA3CB|nr:hypothetical protein [Methanosarcina horonobensis]
MNVVLINLEIIEICYLLEYYVRLLRSPFSVEQEGISISVERTGDRWTYRRKSGKDEVEKLILGDRKRIIINPVEPLNTPKEITPNLLIEFEKNPAPCRWGEKNRFF